MIIYNAIKTPDGTIVRSFSTHDYRCYTDANGYEYCVDGGTQYLRRTFSAEAPLHEDISIYSKDVGHEVIRKYMSWGTRGKEGISALKYVALEDLDTEHIKAIIETQWQISKELKDIFNDELNYRSK